jgi:hypothetical protein
VVDADVLARQAVEPGTPAYATDRGGVGPGVVASDGGLDRAALRRIVFADPSARERLESIVHPAVAELREEAYRAAASVGSARWWRTSPFSSKRGWWTTSTRWCWWTRLKRCAWRGWWATAGWTRRRRAA